jgi:hypothetical protein
MTNIEWSVVVNKDVTAQLVILSDALVKIVDLTPIAPTAAPAELLDRASAIAAEALVAAATFGQLPPFAEPLGDPLSPR